MAIHIKSKQRVTDHGEVFTQEREVNAMLDLVKQETERIESRFLEPACGEGNFLIPVLERKLRIVEERYGRSQVEFERNAMTAVGSLYGVDIQQDNVELCRSNLYLVLDRVYTTGRRGRRKPKQAFRDSVRFILKRNIVWGDALKLTVGTEGMEPIVFSEWSAPRPGMISRVDWRYDALVNPSQMYVSDRNQVGWEPHKVRDYGMVRYLEVAQWWDS